MSKKTLEPADRIYVTFIVVVMFVLPILSIAVEMLMYTPSGVIAVAGKWVVFWAIGVRLLIAGIRQAANPEFTAKDIFKIDDEQCYPIVRELGFANLCSGLTGIISLFVPAWRAAAAFIGGLYMGIAGVNHVIRRPSGGNELVAMVSDLFVLATMVLYLGDQYLVK